MKFGMLATVTFLVAGFVGLEASAQEAIQSTGTVVTTSDYRVAQPGRTGLFSRLRNRNNVTPVSMTTSPSTTTVPTTPPPAPVATTTIPTTAAPLTTQSAEPRQGLFARLRARR